MDYSSAISISSAWFAMALVFTIAVVTKMAARSRRTTAIDPLHSRPPPPPVVSTIALLRLLPGIFREGPEAAMRGLHAKLGGVFTVSFLFGQKVTFLVGQEEVLSHFFRAPASEISRGNLFEFTVPMFGREVGYGVDRGTRDEQLRIFVEALKPSKLRSHVDPMLREVKAYFSRWGEEGIVDLKHELEEVLMLISSRCLLGKEVREKMFDEFRTFTTGNGKIAERRSYAERHARHTTPYADGNMKTLGNRTRSANISYAEGFLHNTLGI